jgi:hypothetical protein
MEKEEFHLVTVFTRSTALNLKKRKEILFAGCCADHHQQTLRRRWTLKIVYLR